jgi:hypothetical protein
MIFLFSRPAKFFRLPAIGRMLSAFPEIRSGKCGRRQVFADIVSAFRHFAFVG